LYFVHTVTKKVVSVFVRFRAPLPVATFVLQQMVTDGGCVSDGASYFKLLRSPLAFQFSLCTERKLAL
jgi:hypothetical protein